MYQEQVTIGFISISQEKGTVLASEANTFEVQHASFKGYLDSPEDVDVLGVKGSF
jgi:hypothetical protein